MSNRSESNSSFLGANFLSPNVRKASTSNQNRQVAKLKQDFEGFKFFLLPLNSLLEWESKYDPLIIIALNTLIFGSLSYYDPPLLTTLAVLGLAILMIDFAGPLLTNHFFKSKDWDPVSESKYTRICERVSNLYEHVNNIKIKLEETKKEKQSLYFLIVFFFLLFCAYVGQCIDNFLLTYFGVLMLTLLPGARRHKLLSKFLDKIHSSIRMNGGRQQ